MPVVLTLKAASATAPADAAVVRDWATLLLVVAVIFVLLMIGVALMMIAHRQRRQRRQNRPDQPLLDPWKEAGHRVRMYQRPDAEE